jgi:hypothetical protein
VTLVAEVPGARARQGTVTDNTVDNELGRLFLLALCLRDDTLLVLTGTERRE